MKYEIGEYVKIKENIVKILKVNPKNYETILNGETIICSKVN